VNIFIDLFTSLNVTGFVFIGGFHIESNYAYSFPKSVKSGKNYASLSQSDGKRKNEHFFVLKGSYLINLL